MAWDETPPTAAELGSTDSKSWDATPPTEEELNPPGKLMSAFKGAANNVPLMPQAIAAGTSLVTGGDQPYSQNLERWNKEAGAAKKENPWSYGGGAAVGAIAPLAIPGVGEALEAAPIAGNAVLGAANAISNKDLTKDPGETIKEGAIGAGWGGAVGKAGEMLGQGLGAIKSKFAPSVEHLEANVTSGFLDLNSRALNRLSEGLENPEKVANHVRVKLNELFPGFGDLTDTAGSKYQKLLNAHDQAGDIIGQVIDATSAAEKPYSNFKATGPIKFRGPYMPEADEAIKSLKVSAGKYKSLTSPANAEARSTLEDAAITLKQLQDQGQLNFKNLYEVKKGIGANFNNPRYDNPGVNKAYGIVSDAIDKILDRTAAPNPGMKEAFNHAKEIFSFTSDLLPAMKRGVSKGATGVGGGLTSAGLATAGALGHPMAWPALAVKNMAKYLTPDIGSNVAYKTMNAIKKTPNLAGKAGKIIRPELIDYLSSKYGKKESE